MSFVLALKSIALSLMIVMSIVGNMGVCWVTYNTRSTEPITAMLMMNMAATDLLRGAIDMPFAFITLVSGDADNWLLGDTVCQLTAFVSQTLRLASTLSVACVSIDRYCTIVHAFHYQTVMTQRRAKVMLVSTWLAAATISVLPVFGVGMYRFLPATHHCASDWTKSTAYSLSVLTAGFLLPLVITSVCNVRIFQAARSQSRRVAVNEFSSRVGDRIRGDGDSSRQRAPRQVMWRPRRHRAHAAKIILVVFGTFCCCWAVYVAAHIWNVVCYDKELAMASWDARDPYGLDRWWVTLATFVGFANAVISPYVYTLLNRRMRKTLRKLLIRMCCPTGTVDRRRTTIVFAANVHNMWRTTIQRDLCCTRRREELHTSEMVHRGSISRSAKEDTEPFVGAPVYVNTTSFSALCAATL